MGYYLKGIAAVTCVLLVSACSAPQEQTTVEEGELNASAFVLGTVQDGGSPHPGCNSACCAGFYLHPDFKRKVVCLGISNGLGGTALIEATPDLPQQLYELNRLSGKNKIEAPNAIAISHAHIGHYSGLMYFGREAMSTKKVNVMTMPRMYKYLNENGPWSQLCKLENIVLDSMQFSEKRMLIKDIYITAIQVPHRDEFSETAAFLIEGPHKKLLFIPDIDKWSSWKKNIVELIKSVDYALIDATFYDGNEVPYRNSEEIPHPLVSESVKLFAALDKIEKSKVRFIHMNHTNPLLNKNSEAYFTTTSMGYKVSAFGDRLPL